MPDQTTDLHARVDGFVKAWHADIGARVRAGQLLAEIDAPELDQDALRAEAQQRQAEADLQQARAELEEAKAEVALARSNIEKSRANLEFASIQVRRYRHLSSDRTVATEEYDRAVSDHGVRTAEVKAAEAEYRKRQSVLVTRAAAIRVKEATLTTAQASLRRLHELQGFKRIIAPFDGVVSRRAAENGMLVSPTSGKPLFRVVRPDLLRARLAAPQAFAADLRPGDEASVTIPERPGKAFTARVTRTAGEIEEASRTVTVEVEIPNADGALLAGAYAQVTITGRGVQGTLLIPASAVMMRPQGPTVAVVTGGVAHLRRIVLGRDRGAKVEVTSGLVASDTVLTSPPDGLADGTAVRASTSR
jgi:multidrug efflux pump subunit AcrA (membrane-fusion protein)